jgi:hypothetical protein
MPLLPAVAFDFGDGQALNADPGERFAHLVELERLDDGHDNFHLVSHPFCLRQNRLRGTGRRQEPLHPARTIAIKCRARFKKKRGSY